MTKQHLFTQGSYTKNIDPWHSDGAMWRYNSGAPAMEADELYAKVAAVYRAVNFTADTLSNMPFAIVSATGGTEVDTSEEYKNKVGFLPYPRQLLRLMTQSFLVTNRAYAFQESKGRTVKNLRYIAPSTIQIITDPTTGDLKGFKRTIQATATDYMIDAQGFCNVVYCFNLNWKQELIPDDQSPFMAMLNAAGVNYYADKFIRDYFERGGIKPVILTFDGAMDQTTAERVETVWTKVIRGVYKYWGKVFSGKFDVKPIGEGIEALKDKDVYDNALRNIAIAIGMPQDALLQNADSYATAMVHKSTWFSDTLTPLAQSLSEPLNEQVFKRLGYRFEFRPEVSDPDMDEETQRMSAAKVLYDILAAGKRKDADKAALESLGIDLPQWFTWEEEEPEPMPVAVPPQVPPAQEQQVQGSKHYPGGQDHDQSTHGRGGGGSDEGGGNSSGDGGPVGGVETDASKVTLYQGRGITGLPLANEDGYIYATTNRNLAREYAGVREDHYPNRDVPQTVTTMRGEIREIAFSTNHPLVVPAKETHGNRDKERVVIEQAKRDGYDSVIFAGSAGGDTYVTWMVDKTSLANSVTDAPATTYHPELIDDEDKSIGRRTVSISVPALREMQNWQDLAFRKHRKGLPLSFEWEARDIPADIADGIRARLAEAADEAGIKAAFDVSHISTDSVIVPDDEIKSLADALNELAAAMKVQPAEVKAEPVITPAPQPITINLTAAMPSPGEPTITVNVPEQAAPVVNVTNEVQPAAVTVTNEVQPAPVKVERPKKAKVVRDVDGRITGIES